MDVKEFAKFEEQERLFDREYAGVPYWQYLRLLVFASSFSDEIEKEIIARNKVTLYQKMRILVHIVVNCIKSELALKKHTPVDVVFFSAYNGSDRFYDYWKLPKEITAIRITRSGDIEETTLPGVFNMGWPRLKFMIIRRILKNLHGMTYDEKEFLFLKELEQKVICRFGKCMTAEQMQEKIQDYLLIKKVFQGYYSKLFDRLKPCAIVVTAYQNLSFHPAYEEIKKRKIKLIELQHGINRGSLAYWFEDQRGRNILTPDYMLLFGRIHETWMKLLKNTTCVSIGFPFQENEMKRFENYEADEKTVIVYPTSDERFETVISEFADKAEPFGYKVIVKVHPGQSNNVEIYYPLLSKKKTLEIITDSSKGIYYWLKRGKHHVLADTTVGIEAVAVEGSNICIALNVDHSPMQPLLDWGVARGFQTADELLELILNPQEVDMSHKQKLWEENAKDNMERFFRQMKEQGWPDGVNFRNLTL